MSTDNAEPDAVEDGIIECWCGARGTFDELFDTSGLAAHCGGSGTLYCDCGGDFCVCHFHGSTDCDGCVDCLHDEGWDDDDR